MVCVRMLTQVSLFGCTVYISDFGDRIFIIHIVISLLPGPFSFSQVGISTSLLYHAVVLFYQSGHYTFSHLELTVAYQICNKP